MLVQRQEDVQLLTHDFLDRWVDEVVIALGMHGDHEKGDLGQLPCALKEKLTYDEHDTTLDADLVFRLKKSETELLAIGRPG